MRSSGLYFFLLVLRVFFNLTPDIIHKRNRFFKILLEKDFKFVLCEKSDPVPLNLSLMLLLAEVDPISEKQGYKEDVLVARGTAYAEMILALSIKVVALYIQARII